MRRLRHALILLLGIGALGLALTFLPFSGPLMIKVLSVWGLSQWRVTYSEAEGNLWEPIELTNLAVRGADGQMLLEAGRAQLNVQPAALLPFGDGHWLRSITLADAVAYLPDGVEVDPVGHTVIKLLFQRGEGRARAWRGWWRADWLFVGTVIHGTAEPSRLLIEAPARGVGSFYSWVPGSGAFGGLIVRDPGRLLFEGRAPARGGLEMTKLELLPAPGGSQPHSARVGFAVPGSKGTLQATFNRPADSAETLAVVVDAKAIPIEVLDPAFLSRLGIKSGLFDFNANWTATLDGTFENFGFEGRGLNVATADQVLGEIEFAGHATPEDIQLRRLVMAHLGNRLEATAKLPRQLTLDQLATQDWRLTGLLSITNPAAILPNSRYAEYLALDADGELHARIDVGRKDGWAWGRATATGANVMVATIPFEKLDAELAVNGRELRVERLELLGSGDRIKGYAWMDLDGEQMFRASLNAKLTHLDGIRQWLGTQPAGRWLDADALELDWQADGNRNSHSAGFTLQLHEAKYGTRTQIGVRLAMEGSYSPESVYIRSWSASNGALTLQGDAFLDEKGLRLDGFAQRGADREVGALHFSMPNPDGALLPFLKNPRLPDDTLFEASARSLSIPMEEIAPLLGLTAPGTGEIWGRIGWRGSRLAPDVEARLVLPDFRPEASAGVAGPVYVDASGSLFAGYLTVQAKSYLPKAKPALIQAVLPWNRSTTSAAGALRLDAERLPLGWATWIPKDLLPVQIEKGRISGKFTGYGTGKNPWNADGNLWLDAVSGKLRSPEFDFQDADARLKFSGSHALVEAASVSAAGGRISLEGEVRNWSSPNAEVTLAVQTEHVRMSLPFQPMLTEAKVTGPITALRIEGDAWISPSELMGLDAAPSEREPHDFSIFQSVEGGEGSALPFAFENVIFDLRAMEETAPEWQQKGTNNSVSPVWRVLGAKDSFRFIREAGDGSNLIIQGLPPDEKTIEADPPL